LQVSKRTYNKTVKAYSIDLHQYSAFSSGKIEKDMLTCFIEYLHKSYKPKTVKRKTAALKAFVNYLCFEEIIEYNPFLKIKTAFKQLLILPKTIPLNVINKILVCAYAQHDYVVSEYRRSCSLSHGIENIPLDSLVDRMPRFLGFSDKLRKLSLGSLRIFPFL